MPAWVVPAVMAAASAASSYFGSKGQKTDRTAQKLDEKWNQMGWNRQANLDAASVRERRHDRKIDQARYAQQYRTQQGQLRRQQLNANREFQNTVALQKWQQRAHMQQIFDRTQDAKKAGVHPLFALGASSGSSPTIAVPSGASSGSSAPITSNLIPGQAPTGDFSATPTANAALSSTPNRTGAVINDISNAILQFDQAQREKQYDKANLELLNAQKTQALAGAQLDFTRSQFTASQATRQTQRSRHATGPSTAASEQAMQTGNVGNARVALDLLGKKIMAVPGRTGAQEVAEYSGEPGEWIQGGLNLAEALAIEYAKSTLETVQKGPKAYRVLKNAWQHWKKRK